MDRGGGLATFSQHVRQHYEKRRGIGGTVKLRVLVNPSGTVRDVQVLGGNPILSDCAVKAVKQWMFVASEKEESIEISVGFDPNSTEE